MFTIRKSALLVLCVAALSQLTFTSCKDEELTEEEQQQKQEQENNEQFLLTSEFWQVVGQLSNAEVLPDDWQNATFEPGIGEASDKSATTRIVPTNDASAAAESFEHLTGVDVSNLIAYEWTRDFGTLTYHRLNDGTGWAAVDVDIKQMPGLKRIVYCTPEQQGLNAKVPGVPYYRFGDVIKKKNENEKWEYWVCVRPCFGPEEKGDMHWMCLGNLPEKNIKSYTYTKQNRTWYWPTGLTTNYEHIKNLSEMTSAILYPEQWANYYESHQNKKLFHDFSYANIKYHNRYFWQLVQDAWDTPVPSEGNKTIFQLLFYRDRGQLEDSKSLNYFYGSASGPGTFSWYMNLNLISAPIHLSEGFKCRDLVKQTSNKSCEKKEFDIREYSEKGYSTKARDSSFIEPYAYVYPLRYATGKQLFGSQPGYYQSMGGSNNIEDVYVFNKHYKQETGSGATMTVFNNDDVQKIQDEAKGYYYGESFYRLGDVLKDKEGNFWFCIKPSGVSDKEAFTEAYPDIIPSDKSYFVSLTPPKQAGNEQYRTYLPSREDAISIGLLLGDICFRGPITLAIKKSDMQLAYEHIKNHAGVDLMKIFGVRDSLHNQNAPDQPPFKNHVPVLCTNIAYFDADAQRENKQALMRVIYSMTGRAIKNGQIQYGNRYCEGVVWSHYEGGNQETMYLQDLTSQEKVNMYASGDRWVTLPWYTDGHKGLLPGEGDKKNYPHEKPRSTAYSDIKCSYFDWDKETMEFNTTYRSMYNEPILFCRLMAVHDRGIQELKSTDGREFEVVSLIEADGINTTWPRDRGLLNADASELLIKTFEFYYSFNGERTPFLVFGYSRK